MVSVIVSYTVKPEFAEENQKNIHVFLEDLKNMNSNEFRYDVFLQDDGVTFLHHSTYLNDNIQTIVLNTPSFREFQRIRDEKGGLDGSHKVQVLKLLGSSRDNLHAQFEKQISY